jgi:uncharacterized protein (DUF1499 family)
MIMSLGGSPEDVIVDYTGGTKVMTAALILATIGHPFRFNYVGGVRGGRNKDGLGAVVNGHEKMYPEMNPWLIFAEEERRQIVILFNRRRFSAAIQIIDTCPQELPSEIDKYFSFVRPAHAIEPLAYDGSWPQAKEKLLQTLRSMKRCRIVTEQADYIHAEFTSVIFRFVDDVEFLADDLKKLIHVRSASRVGYSDFGVNRRRVETIRNLIKASHIPLHETKNP